MLCALACEINVVIPIFMAGETEAEVSWECCAPSSTLTCLVSSVCGDTRPSECMAVRMAASGVRNAVRSHIQASGWPGQEHVGLRILTYILDSWEVLSPLSVGHHTSYILFIFLSKSPGK